MGSNEEEMNKDAWSALVTLLFGLSNQAPSVARVPISRLSIDMGTWGEAGQERGDA